MTTKTTPEDIGMTVADDPLSALLSAFDPSQNEIDKAPPEDAQALLIAGLTLNAKGNEMLAQRSISDVTTAMSGDETKPRIIPLGRSAQRANSPTPEPNKVAPTAPPTIKAGVPFDLNEAVQRSTSQFDSFDVEAELTKLRSIEDANERYEYSATVQANIAIRAAGILQKYQKIAAGKAGLEFAVKNLENNIQLDQASGFYAKFGEASKQTEAAQALLNQARISTDGFAKHLAESDPEFAKLTAVNKRLSTMETLVLNQANRDAIRDEKKDSERAFVSTSMMANYKFMTGDPETDSTKIKDAIVARYKKEPTFRKVVEASKEDLPALLVDGDAAVRQDAFKVLSGMERVLRQIPAGSPDPKYITDLQKIVQNPNSLLAKQELLTKDEKEALAGIAAKTGKEKEQAFSTLRAQVLTRFMETSAKNAFTGDLRTWKTTETADGSLLGGVIKEVSQANAFGPADLSSVVSKFMLSDFIVPPGTPGAITALGKTKLSHAAKQKILETASAAAIANMGKSVLVPSMDTLSIEMRNRVRIEAQKATARAEGLFGIGTNLFGFSPITF